MLIAADAILAEITSVIVEQCDPERVILFGSRARGDHQAGSDYDIFVVVDWGAELLRETLRDRYRVDVHVDTPSVIARRREDVGTMEYVVDREGRVVYDRGRLDEQPASALREAPATPAASFYEWMESARRDYRAMELVAGEVFDATCFHAHQSAEKFLKAALVSERTPPQRTHKLSELLRLSAPELRDDPAMRTVCATLDVMYDASRYPKYPLPAAEDAEAAVIAAGSVRASVEAFTAR